MTLQLSSTKQFKRHAHCLTYLKIKLGSTTNKAERFSTARNAFFKSKYLLLVPQFQQSSWLYSHFHYLRQCISNLWVS